MNNLNMLKRQLTIIENYADPDDVYQESNRKKSLDMEVEAYSKIQKYHASKKEIPSYCFILHEVRDGELAAKTLCDEIDHKQDYTTPVHNPLQETNDITRYIKRRRLIEEAKKNGIWEHQPFFTKDNIARVFAFFITTALSIISIILSVSDNGLKYISFINEQVAGRLLLFTALICVLLAILVFFSIRREGRKTSVSILCKKLNEFEDKDFIKFIENFGDKDFFFADFVKEEKDTDILICALRAYNKQQIAMLRQYLVTSSQKQLWWIFLNRKTARYMDIHKNADQYNMYVYYLNPLTLKEKRNLAKQLELNFNDPAIPHCGADYICRSYLHSFHQDLNETELKNRINSFIAEKKINYSINIKSAVLIIAEMAIQYHVDFSKSSEWEYLFDYPNTQVGLQAYEKTLMKKLLFVGNTEVSDTKLNEIKYLVPDIFRNFADDFRDILTIYALNVRSKDFAQLCIIKALKRRGRVSDDRCLSIAEVLFETVKSTTYLSDFCEDMWPDTFVEVLRYFDRGNFTWYSPYFLYLLLQIYAESKSADIRAIFAHPIVLKTARNNLLLNISVDDYQDSDPDRTQNIDTIEDHYQICKYAYQSLEKQSEPDLTRKIPRSLELLRLNQIEKRIYYRALCELGEDSVLQYYDYLYDMYRFSLLKLNRIEIWDSVIQRDALLEKYNTVHQNASYSIFIYEAIRRMIQMLKALYCDNGKVYPEVLQLEKLIDHSDTDLVIRKCLFLLTKWDAEGTTILSFIACLICRIKGEDKVSSDLYLNLGNYLVNFVYLTYYELNASSFINQDFQYLIRILTDYYQPCDEILCFIILLEIKAMPKGASKRVSEYLQNYKDESIAFISDNITLCPENYLEDLVMFLCMSSLVSKDNRNKDLYLKARDYISANYPENASSPALIRLLTVKAEGLSSEISSKQAVEETLKELNDCSADIAYHIYKEYLSFDWNKYMEGCYIVADKLLHSLMSVKYIDVCLYVLRFSSKDPAHVIPTAHLLYSDIQSLMLNDVLLSNSIVVLEYMYHFISLLKQKPWDDEESKSWVDTGELDLILIRIQENRDFIIKVETEEYFRKRIWKKYGIISYLKFLMESYYELILASPDYRALSAESKLDYITNDFLKIEPVITYQKQKYINRAYIDMLNAFLKNKKNIQNKFSEYDCLMYFALSAYPVVDAVVKDKKQKAEIYNMLDTYISYLKKK